MNDERRPGRVRWRTPTQADLRPMLYQPSSTPVGNSPAFQPQRVVHGGGRSAQAELPEPDELLQLPELWRRMGERGGFYVRKWFWNPGTRFLVVTVTDDRDDPRQRAVVGTLCTGEGARSAAMTQDLDEPIWQLAGITGRRLREDAACASLSAPA